MKKILTSALALAISLNTTWASAPTHDTASETDRKTSTVSLASLWDENRALRLRAETLADAVANLQSALDYETMMHRMFAHLETQAHQEAMAELESTVAYAKMMGNMMLTIHSQDFLEKVEEKTAQANYEKMMRQLFAQLPKAAQP
jgi:hypothetical protein